MIEVGCLWPLAHMTGGALLIFEFVGEIAAKGLRDRRKPSGELAYRQSSRRKAKSGESYISEVRDPLVKR
jgi:hypothetical protein